MAGGAKGRSRYRLEQKQCDGYPSLFLAAMSCQYWTVAMCMEHLNG